MVLKTIHDFFSQNINQPAAPNTELAVAALLTEVMMADGEIDQEELTKLSAFITQFLKISASEVKEIISLAQTENQATNDMFQFTHLINTEFSYEKKVALVKGLWQIAYADHQLDKYEEHTIRKISDLLYIRHSDYIKAKQAIKYN